MAAEFSFTDYVVVVQMYIAVAMFLWSMGELAMVGCVPTVVHVSGVISVCAEV
jgi:hypothetical protein